MIFDDSKNTDSPLELEDDDEWIMRVNSIDRLGTLIRYILQREIGITGK